MIRLLKFIAYEFWGELYFFDGGDGQLLYRQGVYKIPLFRTAYLVTSNEKRDQIKVVQRKIGLVKHVIAIPLMLGAWFHFPDSLVYFFVHYFPASLLPFILCALLAIVYAFWASDRIHRLTTAFPVVRASRMIFVFWIYHSVSIHKFREFAEPFDRRTLLIGMFIGWCWVALSIWLIIGDYHVVLPVVQLYYSFTASVLTTLMTFAKE